MRAPGTLGVCPGARYFAVLVEDSHPASLVVDVRALREASKYPKVRAGIALRWVHALEAFWN